MSLAAATIRKMKEMGLTLDQVLEIAESIEAERPEPTAAAIRTRRYRERGGGQIPSAMREAVFQRDGYTCVYCASTDYLQCDHDIPVSKGGETSVENLVTACRVCNARKKDRDRKAYVRSLSVGKSTDISSDNPGTKVSPKERSPRPPKENTPSQDTNLTTVSLVSARAKKSRRVPDDYQPSQAIWATATAEGFVAGELERELAKFRDHQFRDAHTDWDAAFRNWLRRAAENRRHSNGQPSDKLSAKQANLERAFRAGQSVAPRPRLIG